MTDKTIGEYDTITPTGTEKIEVETAASESKNVTIGDIVALVSIPPIYIQFAASAETGDLTAGTNVVTFRAPRALTVTEVRASLTTASTSGGVTFDINMNGATMLSTKLTIDQDEKTSTTAAVSAVVSTPDMADDVEITVDIDAPGTGAAGAKITIIGTAA